jgi:hypothetical protein
VVQHHEPSAWQYLLWPESAYRTRGIQTRGARFIDVRKLRVRCTIERNYEVVFGFDISRRRGQSCAGTHCLKLVRSGLAPLAFVYVIALRSVTAMRGIM